MLPSPMIRLFSMKRPNDLLVKTVTKLPSVGLKIQTGGMAVLSTWFFSAIITIHRKTDRKSATVPRPGRPQRAEGAPAEHARLVPRSLPRRSSVPPAPLAEARQH